MKTASRADHSAPGRIDLDTLPPTISVTEAGQILGIGRASAYAAARAGELPSLRIGRRLVVPTARLRQMLEAA